MNIEYQPIQIDLGGKKADYRILPNVRAEFKSAMNDSFSHAPSYFAQTLTHHVLRHHAIIPNDIVEGGLITSCERPVDYLRHHFFTPLEKLTGLTIGLCPWDADFKPEMVTYDKRPDGKIPFRYVRTVSPAHDLIIKRLQEIVTTAVGKKVDFLIFPELSMDHDCLTMLIQVLNAHNQKENIKLVVAGSYHTSRPEGGYYNEAAMLDWQGKILWRHRKQRPFACKIKEMNVATASDSNGKNGEAPPENEIVEKIHTNNPLIFIDTPIGRMTTLICLDYLLGCMPEILEQLPVDYIWVPAMSPTMADFHHSASNDYAKKHRILTACCNSARHDKGGEPASSQSFVHVPVSGSRNPMKLKNAETLTNIPLFIFKVENQN